MKDDVKIAVQNMVSMKHPFQFFSLDICLVLLVYVFGNHQSVLFIILVVLANSLFFDFVRRLFEIKNGLEFQTLWTAGLAAKTFNARLLDVFLFAANLAVLLYLMFFGEEGFNVVPSLIAASTFYFLYNEWTAYRQR